MVLPNAINVPAELQRRQLRHPGPGAGLLQVRDHGPDRDGAAVPGARRDPRRHARGDRHAARSCARTAATRSSSSRSSRCCCPGQDPVTMLLLMAPAGRALRGLYPLGLAARPARARAARARRPSWRLATTATSTRTTLIRRLTCCSTSEARPAPHRQVVYITLAFLMGGGLVLFGIGGSGALRRPGRRDHRQSSGGGHRRRPLPASSERGGAGQAPQRQPDRTPPPGPRSPAPASSSPASATNFDPTHGDLHRRRQGAARGAPATPGRSTSR